MLNLVLNLNQFFSVNFGVRAIRVSIHNYQRLSFVRLISARILSVLLYIQINFSLYCQMNALLASSDTDDRAEKGVFEK